MRIRSIGNRSRLYFYGARGLPAGESEVEQYDSELKREFSEITDNHMTKVMC